MNGFKSNITPQNLSPGVNNCVFAAVVGEDGQTDNQLEAGFVRCGSNTNLDGGCGYDNTLQTYAERDNNGVYSCALVDGSPTGSSVNFSVHLVGLGSNTYHAFVNNADWFTQGNITTRPISYAWGELNAPKNAPFSGCANHFSLYADLDNIYRYDVSSNSWSPVNIDAPYRYPPSESCLDFTWNQTSTGGSSDVYGTN